MSRFRTSSHNLEIEKGRHAHPKTPLDKRLCKTCKVLEDEMHFLLHCSLYKTSREILIGKVADQYPLFNELSHEDKFTFLLSYNDPQILTWTAKFIHDSLQTRNCIINWTRKIRWFIVDNCDLLLHIIYVFVCALLTSVIYITYFPLAIIFKWKYYDLLLHIIYIFSVCYLAGSYTLLILRLPLPLSENIVQCTSLFLIVYGSLHNIPRGGWYRMITKLLPKRV